MNADEINKQLNGARNLFYGTLQGVDSMMNIPIPDYVYHYTNRDKFTSIIQSETIRLYTVANFEDKKERNLSFEVEKRVYATFKENSTGITADFGQLVCGELSKDHVFVQSTSIDDQNCYLWKNYADDGKGACLRLSTSRFIDYLNSVLPDFELIPDYFKCCHISYDSKGLNQLLDIVATVIQKSEDNLSPGTIVIWFFLVEYWRNFLKTEEPYRAEKEFRLVVSDNYSVFLQMCGIIARWGNFKTTEPEELSKVFHAEAQRHKSIIHSALGFESSKSTNFVKVPLYDILEGVLIGPNLTLSKDDISILSNRKIRKSTIKKSYAQVG